MTSNYFKVRFQGEPNCRTRFIFFSSSSLVDAWAQALATAKGDLHAISVWKQPQAHGLWRNASEVGEGIGAAEAEPEAA